jgi:hypothetical protein
VTGNRDSAWLGGVLVLPMAALHNHQIPAIVFYQLDNVTNLHCRFVLPKIIGVNWYTTTILAQIADWCF